MSVEETFYNYYREKWAHNKAYVLELLYLGCNHKTLVIAPFNAKINSTMIGDSIKPTLSPFDPNFTEWWDQHKAEWE